MTDVEIRPLDLSSNNEIRAFWEVGRDAVADRPYNTFVAWRAARTYLPMEFPDRVRLFEAAWDGDRMVGALSVSGSTRDNLHLVWVGVEVLPDHRRRGLGSQLLARAEEWTRAQGRRALSGEVFAPVDGSSPALGFATKHGFRVVLEDGMKVVDVPATRDRWEALAAECAPYHQDYELRTVVGALPDELVEGFCAIQNMFMSEAPTGDADVEDEVWDAERVREHQSRAAQAGRRDVTTIALTRDGEVAAMTELFVNESLPHRGFQSGTLVVPAHRGHRLGLAVKVANQQALHAQFPELAFIITGNADVNAHMNAINDRLGFRIVERCLHVEKAL